MGTYWRWSNVTKKLHLEPLNEKRPFDEEVISHLLDLARGKWAGDMVVLCLDDLQGTWAEEWPVEYPPRMQGAASPDSQWRPKHCPWLYTPAPLEPGDVVAMLDEIKGEPKPEHTDFRSPLITRGIIFGTAIGDALGYQVEFDTTVTPNNRKVFDLPGDNQYSDDTQMLVATLEGLLDVGTWDDSDSAAKAIAQRYVEWSQSPENNRAPGNTCMAACRNLARGTDWRSSGIEGSKGCGAAMKAMAYSVWHPNDPVVAGRWAYSHATMTHDHKEATEASRVLAESIGWAIKAKSKDGVYADLVKVLEASTLQLPIVTWVYCSIGDSAKVLDALRGWVADEAVMAAIYCFLVTANFRDCVLLAANSPGDSDSIACMAGALAGAFYGFSAIPVEWVERIENCDKLADLAKRVDNALITKGETK